MQGAAHASDVRNAMVDRPCLRSPRPLLAAEIAFDSFGPNFTYDANLGFVVGVDGFGVNSIGVRFTSEATGLFSTLWIAANAKDAPKRWTGLFPERG